MTRPLVIVAGVAIATAALVILASAAGPALSPAPAQAAPAASQSAAIQSAPAFQVPSQLMGITVTGEGLISVTPDMARVTLGVEVSNPSAQAAQQQAAAAMTAVINELRARGIEERDIRTTRYDLSPEYDTTNRTPVLRGYRVTNLVTVTVRDISRLGEVLDAVVASGATRTYGIGFDVSDPAAAGQQGREEAMNNARSKAEQLARLAGVTLGRPINIIETSSAPPTPFEMAPRAAPADAIATPISPGTQEVRTMVQVTYAIQ